MKGNASTITTTKNKGVYNTKNNIEFFNLFYLKRPTLVQVENSNDMIPLQYYDKEHNDVLMTRSNLFGEDDKVRKNEKKL